MRRLSIARAIYQNSSILIMDEATSALDMRSELLLKEALSNLITKHSVTVSFCVAIPALACFPISIYC
jgi:putative ABC transport system ATP-binding protein